MAKYFYVNEWAGATLTALTAHANHPASNLLTRSPTEQYWTTSKSAQYVQFDGSANMQIFFIKGHNLTAAANVRIQGSPDDFATTPFSEALTQGTGLSDQQWVHFTNSPVNYDYWRLYVDDPGNTSDNLKIGVVWHGATYWESADGYDDQSGGLKPSDPSVTNYSVSRQASSVVYPKSAKLSHNYSMVRDRVGLLTFFDTVGTASPFVVLEKPYDSSSYGETNDFSHYVHLDQAVDYTGIVREMWTGSVVMELEK